METWDIPAGLGCNSCQGYYISKPIDPGALTRWVRESSWGGKAPATPQDSAGASA